MIPCHHYQKLIFFVFDNDDMESLKRPGQNSLFNCQFAPFSCLNLTLHIPDTFFFLYIHHQFMLIFFAFENDDMESLKHPERNFLFNDYYCCHLYCRTLIYCSIIPVYLAIISYLIMHVHCKFMYVFIHRREIQGLCPLRLLEFWRG